VLVHLGLNIPIVQTGDRRRAARVSCLASRVSNYGGISAAVYEVIGFGVPPDLPDGHRVIPWQVDFGQPGGDIAMLKIAATGRDPHEWAIVLLQGVALFILGLLLITAPEIATLVLVAGLGIYWLTSGILSIVRLATGDRVSDWLRPLLAGILGIVAGLVVIQHPRIIAAITPLGVVVVLGAVAILWGALDIVQGVRGGAWALIATGILDIIVGLLLLGSPATIAAALPAWLGILGMVGAVALIAIAYRMRVAATERPKSSSGGPTETT
jgi:uncharacterized membrane protein HdeD (DUF308 family)